MKFFCITLVVVISTFFTLPGFSQKLLGRVISLEIRNQPTEEALKLIARKADVTFSYGSNIIPQKNHTLSIHNKSVEEVLRLLLGDGYELREFEQYVIIRKADDQFWYISGYVKNDISGEGISNASVYETEQLAATLTNEVGYFKLKLKSKHPVTAINVSKSWFQDNRVFINPGNNQQVTVHLTPKDFQLDSIVIYKNNRIEATWIGRLLISSKQRMLGLNLSRFWVEMPYQISLIPGLGTHGKMSGQVTNNLSINMVGGYTAATHGLELGGVFNIVKKESNGTQIAGLYNTVGGKVSGLQISGLVNKDFDSANAFQLAGIANIDQGSIHGLQISSTYNQVGRDMNGVQFSIIVNRTKNQMRGLQLSGIANIAKTSLAGVQIAGGLNDAGRLSGVQLACLGNRASYEQKGAQIASLFNRASQLKGLQIAGVANIVHQEQKGLQVAGLVNYASRLKGVQLGVINIVDTSEGFSVGVINIVLHGYHSLSVYNSDVTNLNIAYKSGYKKFYNILTAGANIIPGKRAYAFGLGLGSEIPLAGKLSFHPEITVQDIFLGEWNKVNLLGRGNISFQWKLTKDFALIGGPCLNYYSSYQNIVAEGYTNHIPLKGAAKIGDHAWSWLGWNIGICLF